MAQRPKILIVEDESAILRALSRVFEMERFAVVAAEDGMRGLEAALREKPDVILLDVVMPGMNGMSMLAAMRKEGGAWASSVPVIAYTNLNYHEVRDEARGLDITDFLIKSDVPLADVVARVKRALARRKGEIAEAAA